MVGTHTCILCSADSCRYRSNLAELCSGPAPSYPWGSKHGEPGESRPLVFARSDKLIYDYLGTIRKVTELRFPNHQGCSDWSLNSHTQKRAPLLPKGTNHRDRTYSTLLSRLASGVNFVPFCWSCSTACRCAKVPLPISWPSI